jgi:hypothetical protein
MSVKARPPKIPFPAPASQIRLGRDGLHGDQNPIVAMTSASATKHQMMSLAARPAHDMPKLAALTDALRKLKCAEPRSFPGLARAQLANAVRRCGIFDNFN